MPSKRQLLIDSTTNSLSGMMRPASSDFGVNLAYPQPNLAYPQPNYAYPQPNYAYPQPNYAYPQPNLAYPQPNYAYPQPNLAYPQPNYAYPQSNYAYPQSNYDYLAPTPAELQSLLYKFQAFQSNLFPYKKPKPDVPMPSYDSSTVAPMIFDLKSKLAQLEEEIYRTNGPQMKAKIESIWADLDGTNFETVLAALETLCEILDPKQKTVYSYEPYLNGQANRIVLLLAKQLHQFNETYRKTVPDSAASYSQVQWIVFWDQKFLEFCQLLCTAFSYLVQCPIKLGRKITKSALYELIKAGLHHVVITRNRQEMFRMPLHDGCIENNLFNSILLKNRIPGKIAANELNYTTVLAVHLCLYREHLAEFQKPDVSLKVKQSLVELDRILTQCDLPKFANQLPTSTDLSAVFYELYKLFDVYSGATMSVELNMRPLEDAKQFITTAYRCGFLKQWDKQFAQVTNELKQMKRDQSQVALYKWMASAGLNQPKQTLVEPKKPTAYPAPEQVPAVASKKLPADAEPAPDQVPMETSPQSNATTSNEKVVDHTEVVPAALTVSVVGNLATTQIVVDRDGQLKAETPKNPKINKQPISEPTNDSIPVVSAPTADQPEPEIICFPGTSSTGPAESEVIVIPTEQTDLDDNSQTLIEAVKQTAILDTANSKIVDNELPKDANSVTRDEVNKQVELMKIQMEESRNLVEKLMAMYGNKKKHAE